MRWTDFIKEATAVMLQDPGKAAKERILWKTLIHMFTIGQKLLDGS